ncbi:MAG: tail fiber domain-containing protein [Flavisolibacter sp.]
MKKILFFTLSTLLISFGSFAQSWNLTGNNNATPTSILGTTNSVPLRLFTKNLPRITIDTFGFVGINSAHPVSTLDVRGTQFLQGTLKFSTGANGIQFANPTTTSNKAMMYMFNSGSTNLPRMVIAHSTAIPNSGLQYDDVNDNFNFLTFGYPVFTVSLGSYSVSTGGSLTVNGLTNVSGSGNFGGNGNFGGVAPPHSYRLYLNQGYYGLGIQPNGSPNFWEIVDVSDWLELYYNDALRGAFNPSTGAYSSGSDKRLKSNIKPMESVLDKIMQLKPSSYQFKDVKDKQFYDGFIAQEVLPIFPNLVYATPDRTKKMDIYTMNYSGFGVIAIKGIQELHDQIQVQNQEYQNQIQDLKNEIKELKDQINKIAPRQLQNVSAGTALEQNFPNPVTNSTSIGYTIPTGNSSAQLRIIDNLGRTVKTVALNASGRVNLDVSALSNGTYTYSLIVDGKVVETRKLVKASE